MDKDLAGKVIKEAAKGYPRNMEEGPNAFNDEKMADDVLEPRDPDEVRPVIKARDDVSG